MPVSLIKSGTLGSVNVGLAAAVGFLNPLGAQVDALLGIALGPLQADLSAQFNAALSAQASLSLQISNPLAGLQLAIAAVAQLQAALQAALALPPIQLSIGAELSASAALSASLSAKLGGLQILIEAALGVKIPAVQAGAALAASLGAGPIFLHSFDGSTLASTGSEINSLFSSGLVDGSTSIAPGEPVSGFIFTTKDPAAFASLDVVFVSF